MKKVTVPLDSRFYDILIGEDLISKFPIYLEGILSRNFLAIIKIGRASCRERV